jgi:hypothetical protein
VVQGSACGFLRERVETPKAEACATQYFSKCESVIIAVGVRIAAAWQFGVARQSLPGFLADGYCVLRRWILRCGLRLQRLGCLNCFFCLFLRVGYL